MKKPARPSFYRQLSLRYAASFLLLLLLLGGITWLNLHHCLVSSLDRNLLVIAHSEGEFASQNGPLQLHHTSNILPDTDMSAMPSYVQVSDAAGRVLVANHPLSPPLPLDAQDLRTSLEGKPVFARIWYQGQPYRILYLSLLKAGQPYSLQTASPLQPVYETLWEVMGIYALSSVAMLALACWLGGRLARRAIAPIKAITAVSERISLHQLSERIPTTTKTPQELHELSQMLNQMLERLEHAAEALQQFTSDAAHELRTPLTVLKGEIQVALRKPRPAEEYRELLESNLEEVNRLIQLAEALLSLSHFEQLSSTGQLLKGATELNQLAAQVLARFQTPAAQQQVDLVLQSAAGAVWTGMHPTYLEQVLFNLVDNALRVSPTHSGLVLSVSASETEARLAVCDQGPGIPLEAQGRIFERFFQVDAARSGNRHHFGIGLSLCKAMVEGHGGRIELESEPGQGSCFRVLLSRLKQHPEAGQVLAQGAARQTGPA